MRLPSPERVESLDDLVARLRLLKAWAHDLSYATITRIVNDRWRRAGRPAGELTTKSTVAGYFTFGRSRLDEELLVAIVSALHDEPAYAERWRDALRAVRGDAAAAVVVDAGASLPPAPTGFIGRRVELRRLDELAAAGGTVVVHGMAGIGKTWLAAHAAHRLRGVQRGRVIHLAADLRGCDGEAPPACPSAVLGVFLRHLGVRSDRIPRDLAGRTEAYRALLREVPALVHLDDAADEDSLAPLLPNTPNCLALVTSRRSLPDLDNASRFRLGGLDAADSLELLSDAAGAGRLDADPAGARRITRSLGHHPLALSIVGKHLRDHPDWLVADCTRPVALALSGGLREAVAQSDRRLPATARRVLRLLALHPGRDIDCSAVAALADITVDAARAHLSALVREQLVELSRGDRYSLHELIRGYAAEVVVFREPASQVRAAATRLFDYYRRATAAAVARLRSDVAPHRLPPGRGLDHPMTDTVEQARRWMADEYPNLLLITAHAAVRGRPELAHFLATTLARYRPADDHGRTPSESVRDRPPHRRGYATVHREASGRRGLGEEA